MTDLRAIAKIILSRKAIQATVFILLVGLCFVAMLRIGDIAEQAGQAVAKKCFGDKK